MAQPEMTFEKIEAYFKKNKGVAIKSSREINSGKFFIQTKKLNFYTHFRYDAEGNIIDSWETTS